MSIKTFLEYAWDVQAIQFILWFVTMPIWCGASMLVLAGFFWILLNFVFPPLFLILEIIYPALLFAFFAVLGCIVWYAIWDESYKGYNKWLKKKRKLK